MSAALSPSPPPSPLARPRANASLRVIPAETVPQISARARIKLKTLPNEVRLAKEIAVLWTLFTTHDDPFWRDAFWRGIVSRATELAGIADYDRRAWRRFNQ